MANDNERIVKHVEEMDKNVAEWKTKQVARIEELERIAAANQEVIDDYLKSKSSLRIDGKGNIVTGGAGGNTDLKSDVGFAFKNSNNEGRLKDFLAGQERRVQLEVKDM